MGGYVCTDKEGATLRTAPTRAKNQKQARQLLSRERVWATDIVTFPDGDAFVHLAPPNYGWVPLTKRSGAEKMQALSEAPPCNRGYLRSHGVAPKSRAKAKSKPKDGEMSKSVDSPPLKPLPVGDRFGSAPVRGSISRSPVRMPMPPLPSSLGAPPPSSMGMPLLTLPVSSLSCSFTSPAATCWGSASPWHSHMVTCQA